MPESSAIAITTVLSTLVIVDIVGNSFVCLIIKRNRDMRYVDTMCIFIKGVCELALRYQEKDEIAKLDKNDFFFAKC